MRLNRKTNQMMVKISTWVAMEEYQSINEKRGDISTSLFVRRAIKEKLLSGSKATNQTPEAAPAEAVITTTTNPTEEEKIEAK